MSDTSAIARWKTRVEAHHTQSVRAQRQSGWSDGDQWLTMVSYFKADPRRSNDPVLNKIASMVAPDATVLDVGGGAGRYALPLALRCRQVTVVEPSSGMVRGLGEDAGKSGVENLSVVTGLWEDVEVEPADIVLCANVVYDVADIGPFVQKLTVKARERVMLLAYVDAPSNQMSPFWKPIYGEDRVDLPGAPEFLQVLWELDIYPNVEMFDPVPPESVPNLEIARQFLRNFLYVRPGTEQDQSLQRAVDELVVATPEGIAVKDSRPRRQALITWSAKDAMATKD